MKTFSARHMYCSSNPRGKMMLFKKNRDTLGSMVWAQVPWKPAQHSVCLADFQTGSVFRRQRGLGSICVCVFIEVKAWGGEEIDWFFLPLNFWNYFLHSICNWTRTAILISSFLEPYARPKNINWLRMWVWLKQFPLRSSWVLSCLEMGPQGRLPSDMYFARLLDVFWPSLSSNLRLWWRRPVLDGWDNGPHQP